MQVQNLYVDSDGESHFRDIGIDMTVAGPGNKVSRPLSTQTMFFRERFSSASAVDSARKPNTDWHPAPRRQYIIYIDGGIKITASDGESRIMEPGAILLVEDTSGKGHLIEQISDKPLAAVYITLQETADQS